jgi:hypothetical protein
MKTKIKKEKKVLKVEANEKVSKVEPHEDTKVEAKVKDVSQLFRKGSVAFLIVKTASVDAIPRNELVKAVMKRKNVPLATVQCELAYLLNPKDPRNGHRVRRDKRTKKMIRFVAA